MADCCHTDHNRTADHNLAKTVRHTDCLSACLSVSRSVGRAVILSVCCCGFHTFLADPHMPKLSLVLFQFLFFLNILAQSQREGVNEPPRRRVVSRELHKPFRVAREIGLAVDADLGLILIFG